MIKPNLFIVGAMKAATTSLYSYLGQHPEIDFCIPKEPNFFGEDGLRASRNMGLVDYTRLFVEHRGRYSGEATVKYLPSRSAAREIAAFNPKSRIIAILRNPIERAYSHYWHNVKIGVERRPFCAAMDDEIRRRGERRSYLELGCYAEQIERYIEAFGDAQVGLVLTERLDVDVSSVCRSLFEFLDLNPDITLDVSARLNPSGMMRLPWLRKTLVESPVVRRAARALLPPELRAEVVWRFDGLMVAKERTPPIAADLRRRLAEYYARDVQRLAGATELDLSLWLDWSAGTDASHA